MTVRIRTTQRVAPGVSVVSYQSPGRYFAGLAIMALIFFAVLHQVFGAAAAWIVSGFVALMWVRSLYSGGLGAKLLWSAVLFFTCYMVWVSHGCVGNTQFCTDLQAQTDANNKKAVIQQAEKDMEMCAANIDWQTDSACRIYTRKEIDAAKARVAAREAADEAEETALLRKAQQEQLESAVKNRDVARSVGNK
jgi:hypothetical protein